MLKKQKNKISKKTRMLLVFTFAITLSYFFAYKNTKISIANDICDSIDECNEKSQVFKEIIELKQKQQQSLNYQISLMDADISQVENEIETNRKKIEELSALIERKELEIKDKEETILLQKKLLSGLLKNYYEQQQKSFMNVFLSENVLSPFMSEKDKLAQIGNKIQEIINGVKSLKEQLENERGNLKKDKEDVSILHSNLRDKNENLQYSKDSKEVLLTKTQGEEKKYQKLLKDIEDEIYELESEKVANYDNLPPAKGGYFDYPLSEIRITQKYGMTSYAKAGAYGGKPHNGVDFGVSYKNVYASRNGEIIASGDNKGYAYGKWIAIDHNDGLITLYGHLSNKSVSKGDKVKKGDKIGVSGDTGYSTGPHLHFSVFDKNSFTIIESKYVKNLYIPTGASVNPMRYF